MKIFVRVMASLILGIAALGLVGLGTNPDRGARPTAPTAQPTPPPARTTPPPSPQATTAAPDTPCGPALRKPDGTYWQCSFVDDFDGTALNPAKWTALTTANTGLRGNGDCWVDRPDTIAVGEGVLNLTTRRMPQPFTCTMLGGATFTSQIASGAVTTLDRDAQTFGRWEIRARFPQITTPGVQAAIWLYPLRHFYGRWPRSGEIDIVEFYSTFPDRLIPYIHYNESSDDPSVTNNRCMVAEPWKFHTFVALWSPGRIVITVDNTTCLDHRIHPAKPLTGTQPFDRPFGVNLSQAVGVTTNSVTAKTPLPVTTQVDYVRVWS